MKKMLLCLSMPLIVGAALTSVNAQVVDFESHSLSPESFDNDAGVSGAFVFNGISFSNYYDSGWDFWTGFSISNITDNTTAGFGNQYGCYTGSGNNGSSNFALYYPEGNITCDPTMSMGGFYISNTSYAAIAMRDGDAYSKQFGSALDATGTPDGTNGEDFFRVWIIAEDAGLTMRDSIVFYLADYRFADNNLDYIVDSWEYIDLQGFSFDVAKLSFLFESSDVGAWGINTPTYFALDDIQYGYLNTNSLSKSNIQVYPNPVSDLLTITGISGEYMLTDAQGKILLSGKINQTAQIDLSDYSKGVYYLHFNGIEHTTERIVR